jgi:hypothetical protein
MWNDVASDNSEICLQTLFNQDSKSDSLLFRSKVMNRFIAWSLLLAIGALLLAQAPQLSNARSYSKRKSSGSNEKYAVVFDAGSSGTRIKVYKLTIAHGPLQVSDVQQVPVPKPDKAKPGLSEFADNIDGIGSYLRPLIDGAKKVIPKDKQASTTIQLFATAGMRLLKKEEVTKVFRTLTPIGIFT